MASALQLRYVDGLSYYEIGHALNVREKDVDEILQRAKELLRRLKP